MAGEPSLLVSRSIGSLLADLAIPPFLRLGRSLVINRDRIRQVDVINRDHTDLRMDGLDDALVLSRAAFAALKKTSPRTVRPSGPITKARIDGRVG